MPPPSVRMFDHVPLGKRQVVELGRDCLNVLQNLIRENEIKQIVCEGNAIGLLVHRSSEIGFTLKSDVATVSIVTSRAVFAHHLSRAAAKVQDLHFRPQLAAKLSQDVAV